MVGRFRGVILGQPGGGESWDQRARERVLGLSASANAIIL